MELAFPLSQLNKAQGGHHKFRGGLMAKSLPSSYATTEIGSYSSHLCHFSSSSWYIFLARFENGSVLNFYLGGISRTEVRLLG